MPQERETWQTLCLYACAWYLTWNYAVAHNKYECDPAVSCPVLVILLSVWVRWHWALQMFLCTQEQTHSFPHQKAKPNMNGVGNGHWGGKAEVEDQSRWDPKKIKRLIAEGTACTLVQVFPLISAFSSFHSLQSSWLWLSGIPFLFFLSISKLGNPKARRSVLHSSPVSAGMWEQSLRSAADSPGCGPSAAGHHPALIHPKLSAL